MYSLDAKAGVLSNTHASLRVNTNGAASGDPATVYTILGVTDWSTGIDNSDSDKFKISRSNLVGTNEAVSIDSNNLLSITTTSINGGLLINNSAISGYIPSVLTN